MPLELDHLDHLAITVLDLDITCKFYEDILGVQVVSVGDGGRVLVIGSQKINLHRAGHPPQVGAQHPQPGSDHLCFITQQPIAEVVDHLTKHGVEIELGPVSRTGSRAELESVYFRDPDGNSVEIANELA